MDAVLWISQGVLALVFFVVGLWKLTGMPAFTEDLSPLMVRLVGTAELLGAVGVVLPAITGILPWLTPVAAVAIVLEMIVAASLHLRNGEYSRITINLILIALAGFVAYGRFFARVIS